MTSIEDASAWIGRTAVDNTGEQIGMITQIWVDDASGEPGWASVKIPALRGRQAIVPLVGAAAFGGGRRFAFSKADIVDAPNGVQDGRLEVADKERLSSYYGAPDAPATGSASWTDRLEDARDGATVREIRALLGDDVPASAPEAPETPEATGARKLGRRFGRKSAPTAT